MTFGIDTLPRTYQQLAQGIQDSLHPGAQLYVSLSGETVANFGIGESRPGVAMTTDTVMLWMSASKPVAAAAIMQLVEHGLLQLHDRVADHLPEFGQNGKDAIQVLHLLTHTCGFRNVLLGEPTTDWDDILQRIAQAKIEPDWHPGQRAGYHLGSSWYILAALVEQLSGRKYSEYVRDEIFLPLGMHDSWIGMPVEQFQAYGDRLGIMQRTDRTGHIPNRWSTEQGATRCAPGANGHGPMHNLARFYQMLLGHGSLDGQQVLLPDSVEQMTRRQRTGMYDETFKHTIDWGLGLIIDSKQYGTVDVPYGYGAYASPKTFGHSGNQSSVAFADPAHQLVVALVFNGMPGDAAHQVRMRAACEAIYLDLQLAAQA